MAGRDTAARALAYLSTLKEDGAFTALAVVAYANAIEACLLPERSIRAPAAAVEINDAASVAGGESTGSKTSSLISELSQVSQALNIAQRMEEMDDMQKRMQLMEHILLPSHP